MKNTIIIATLLLTATIAQSQINWERYNDNFSSLKNDTISKKGFEKTKYIPLFKNSTISFGGEIREQYQYYENQNFGDVPPTVSNPNAIQVWQRVMAHTNIEFGTKWRLFAHLGSTFRFGNPDPLTPEIDENRLSLHQAFLDFRYHKNGIIRVGRQEVFYGNHRMLTFREGPNTRLTFDAAVFKYYTERRKWDVFVMTPVISKKGAFDDQSFKDAIVGIYATERLIPHKLLMDSYTILFNSDRRKYNYAEGHESRETTGLRLYSENPVFNYEVEGTYQKGKFDDLKISAYGFSTDLNYLVAPSKNFIVGFAANYTSGDKNPNDKNLNTYNSLFSKPPFGLVAPIGLSNVANINPYIKINPTKKSNVYAGAYWLRRQSDQDGTYSPGAGGALETRPNPTLLFASTKKEIGSLLALESNYFVDNHLTFGFDASYFFAGDYVKETGKGKDITYVSCRASYKF
ncbi:MAG: alginate export family protein [Flavobacterium sp.]|uniref:alginate export family protein n=1 Tax=Flavobacterium sp. TaxID=239 RepID=UPI003265E6D0